MTKIKLNAETLLVVAIIGAAAWFFFRGVKGVARDVSKAAVDVTAGAVEGTVKGIGEAVGIPDTNQTECERALAEGRMWDASFACPAGTFLRGVFGGATPNQEATDAQTVRQVFPAAGRSDYSAYQ